MRCALSAEYHISNVVFENFKSKSEQPSPRLASGKYRLFQNQSGSMKVEMARYQKSSGGDGVWGYPMTLAFITNS